MKKITFLLLAVLLSGTWVSAQDDAPQTVSDIFYGTRAVNLHTSTSVGKNVLAYRISHRFGDLSNDPLYNFLGLDGPATISFMFDYGLSDKLMIGVGRDQGNKIYNGYVKYNILEQKTSGMPVTLGVYSKANIITLRDEGAAINGFDRFENFAHRMSYVTQIIVARKFGERFSLQLAPTYVHHNLVPLAADKNDIFAAAVIGQYKLTKRLGLSAEYSYVLNEHAANPTPLRNSLAVGFDIVTGGHTFQLHVANSTAINEAFGIPYTTSDVTDGQLRIGFNISRNFWL